MKPYRIWALRARFQKRMGRHAPSSCLHVQGPASASGTRSCSRPSPRPPRQARSPAPGSSSTTRPGGWAVKDTRPISRPSARPCWPPPRLRATRSRWAGPTRSSAGPAGSPALTTRAALIWPGLGPLPLRRDPSGQPWAHLFASYLDSLKRDWAEAITRGGQALALFRRTGDQAGQGWAPAVLGDGHARLENYELARGYARQALEVTPEAGDPTTFAMAWETLGLVHSRLGGPRPAITCYRQVLAFLRVRKQPLACLMQIIMLPEFGDACRAAGDLPTAAGAWQQAQQIRRELGWPESRGSAPGSSRPGRPAPRADRQAPVPALSGRAPTGHPQVPRSPYPAASARRARDLPRYRQHTASTPGAGTVKSADPGVQAPAPRSRDRPRPERERKRP